MRFLLFIGRGLGQESAVVEGPLVSDLVLPIDPKRHKDGHFDDLAGLVGVFEVQPGVSMFSTSLEGDQFID